MTRTLGIAVGRRDRERIQAVLRPELVGLVATPFAARKADTDDAPIALAGQGETSVDVEGLMRAVKVADAEVGDAAFESGPVIGRCCDVRRQCRKR